MKIQLERVDDAFHFVAANESGARIHIDVTEAEGGTNQGLGPMQMVAAALGGCSAIDIIHILRKSRQPVEGFSMEVDYDRAQDQTPAVFTNLHVHYSLTGDLDPDKVRRAVSLSVEKYCSVSKMLEKTADISTSFSINGTRYEATNSEA